MRPEEDVRPAASEIQGYDYLLTDPQPGLASWQEACDRGLRRIRAACLAVASTAQEGTPWA